MNLQDENRNIDRELRRKRKALKMKISVTMIAVAFFLLGVITGKTISFSKIVQTTENVSALSNNSVKEQESLSGVNATEEVTEASTEVKAEVTTEEPEKSVVVGKPVNYSLSQAAAVIKERISEDERYAAIYDKVYSLPQKLVIDLANNPEMLSFVAGYPGTQLETAELTKKEMSEEAPLLIQWDKRWGYHSYGDDSNIAVSGCGPTALTIAVVTLTGKEITPIEVADFAMEKGYYLKGTGTKWTLMTQGAEQYGLSSVKIGISERQIKNCLDAGGVVILSMKKGDFTTGGHFIVVYDYNEKGFLIRDPFCKYRSQLTWSFSDLAKQTKAAWDLQKAGTYRPYQTTASEYSSKSKTSSTAGTDQSADASNTDQSGEAVTPDQNGEAVTPDQSGEAVTPDQSGEAVTQDQSVQVAPADQGVQAAPTDQQ